VERSRGRALAIAAIAAAVAFGVVLGTYLIVRPQPGRSAATTLAELCTALDAGKIDHAYALTTPGFRVKTTQATFGAELTQGTGHAKSCHSGKTGTTEKTPGSISITTESGAAEEWTVTLSRTGNVWEISSLSPVSGLRTAHRLLRLSHWVGGG
jgi:hypothetical protein